MASGEDPKIKLAINQPNFFPWLGYFDLLDQVDVMVFLDHVDWIPRGFIHRNKLRRPDGESQWLTLSLDKGKASGKWINQQVIHWEMTRDKHLQWIRQNYQKAPYFQPTWDLLNEIYANPAKNLAEFNSQSLERLAKFCKIKVQTQVASKMGLPATDDRDQRIFSIIDHLKPEQYYNFARGVDMGFYPAEAFAKRGIQLFKQDYKHPEYRQFGKEPFIPYLSLVDALFQIGGDEVLALIRSGSRWAEVSADLK